MNETAGPGDPRRLRRCREPGVAADAPAAATPRQGAAAAAPAAGAAQGAAAAHARLPAPRKPPRLPRTRSRNG